MRNDTCTELIESRDIALALANNRPTDERFGLRFFGAGNRSWIEAAVLVALIRRESSLNLILTERAANLPRHAGQIAFPGGRAVADDKAFMQTALREAEEEIGLHRDQVKILGTCPCYQTVTGFRIHPFVGAIDSDFQPVLQAAEVASLFEVPFEHLINPDNFDITSVIDPTVNRQRTQYEVKFGVYHIWGATAAILYGLAGRLQDTGGTVPPDVN